MAARLGLRSGEWRVPIGRGTLAEGLYLRVRLPQWVLFSQSRQGWAYPWPEIVRVMQRANQIMAEDLQLLAAMNLEESRLPGRRWQASGRLESAILAPENVYNSGQRFGVGVAKFLNRSQAKYWRQIEEGSQVHVGRRTAGFWLTSGGSFIGPSRNRRSRDRFIASAGGDAFSIAKPIDAQGYFRAAWRQYRVRDKALGALRQAITEVLGVEFKSNARWSTVERVLRSGSL